MPYHTYRQKFRVANLSKKLTNLSNGMSIGVGAKLPEVFANQNQAATISPKERKEEYMPVSDTVASVQYGDKNHEKSRWTSTKKWRPSMTVSWIQTGEKTSILVQSTPKIVRNVWTRFPNLKRLGTDV